MLQIHASFFAVIFMKMDWIRIELTYRKCKAEWLKHVLSSFTYRLSCVGFHYLYFNTIEIDSVLWSVPLSLSFALCGQPKLPWQKYFAFFQLPFHADHGEYDHLTITKDTRIGNVFDKSCSTNAWVELMEVSLVYETFQAFSTLC